MKDNSIVRLIVSPIAWLGSMVAMVAIFPLFEASKDGAFAWVFAMGIFSSIAIGIGVDTSFIFNKTLTVILFLMSIVLSLFVFTYLSDKTMIKESLVIWFSLAITIGSGFGAWQSWKDYE